jgi:hypothetical protein
LKPALSLAPVEAIALELWTTNAALHFDNFGLASDFSSLKKLTERFIAKANAESSKFDHKRKQERAQREVEVLAKGSITEKIQIYVGRVADVVAENQLMVFITCLLLLTTFLYLIIFGGRTSVIF